MINSAALFIKWQQKRRLTIDGAADLIGVSPSFIKKLRRGDTISATFAKIVQEHTGIAWSKFNIR